MVHFSLVSSLFQELLSSHSDVFRDLPEQDGRNVATLVKGNSGTTSVRVAELFVGADLADFREAECFQNSDDLTWLEDGQMSHVQPMLTV